MFFPFIKDIAIRDIVKITIQHTIGEAIQKMIHSGHRNIVVEDGHFYHILLAQDILTLDQNELDLNLPISEAKLHHIPQIHLEKNLLESLHFLQESIEYIAAIDDCGKLVGIVTHTDIINSTDPEILMENYSIGDVVKSQRNDIWMSPTVNTRDVIRKMKELDKDCVILIEDRKPVGIFTIKDVLSLYRNKNDVDQPIAKFMTTDIELFQSDSSIRKAIEFIKSRPFKRLVVVNVNNEIVGMILQKELIAMVYNNWALIMKQHQSELNELNKMLSEQADRYRHLAAFDPLTNLYNRHRFIELYTTEFVAMQQRDHAMSLIMLDVDFFKKINDNHGHNAGDDILRKVSEVIQLPVRNVDIVCRWGGEEFVVLLPTVDEAQALIIAEKLRSIVEQTEMPHGLKVTVSLGITSIKKDDLLENVVARADCALYRAKNSGRNKSVVFKEDE